MVSTVLNHTKRRMKVKLAEIMEKQYGIPMLPDNPVPAMAYVPFQEDDAKIFTPDQGYALGTMYPALSKPFCGGKCGEAND